MSDLFHIIDDEGTTLATFTTARDAERWMNSAASVDGLWITETDAAPFESWHPFDRYAYAVLCAPSPQTVAEVFGDMVALWTHGGLPHLDTRGADVRGYGLEGLDWSRTYIAEAWDARVAVWFAVCDGAGVDPYGLALDAMDARPGLHEIR